MTKRIGFLGTGVISDAVIRGLYKVENLDLSIKVSSRSALISQKLAADFPQIDVISDNQELVNNSDYIVIALKRQIVQEELAKLKFEPNQTIISFVPTISRQLLADYSRHPIEHIYRAVPLPFIAEHQSATPIFPSHSLLEQVFSQTGGVIVANDEHQFDLFMLGGSMMGIYFQFSGICANWLAQQGLEPNQANLFISRLFNCLAQKAITHEPLDFSQLQREYSTPGGTNELITSAFAKQGGVAFLHTLFNQALNESK